jgi:transcriptional regulator with XRE-family HTH domain
MAKRADHNGLRLARARLRRRWTQERLGRESGFSLATVRAIEQGRRSLDNMGQLLTFARALDVPVTDLTGQPYAVSGPEDDAGQGAVAGIRRELLLAEREPRISDAQAVSVSVPALRGRVDSRPRARWLRKRTSTRRC